MCGPLARTQLPDRFVDLLSPRANARIMLSLLSVCLFVCYRYFGMHLLQTDEWINFVQGQRSVLGTVSVSQMLVVIGVGVVSGSRKCTTDGGDIVSVLRWTSCYYIIKNICVV